MHEFPILHATLTSISIIYFIVAGHHSRLTKSILNLLFHPLAADTVSGERDADR